jgi:hypothetical protein
MKKKSYIAVLLFLFAYNFSNGVNNFCIKENDKQDTIKVEFGNQFILYWDCANSRIIPDENCRTILNDSNNIRSMAYFITNQEIVCDFVCTKDTVLRKGDIAYLFLRGTMFIYDGGCLGRDFDVFDYCGYPWGLLNYIEENRDLVFQKVMLCLDNKGVNPAYFPPQKTPTNPNKWW